MDFHISCEPQSNYELSLFFTVFLWFSLSLTLFSSPYPFPPLPLCLPLFSIPFFFSLSLFVFLFWIDFIFFFLLLLLFSPFLLHYFLTLLFSPSSSLPAFSSPSPPPPLLHLHLHRPTLATVPQCSPSLKRTVCRECRLGSDSLRMYTFMGNLAGK